MPGAKGTWIDMRGLTNPQERGGDKRMDKRGPRENYPCILIKPIFLNSLLVYEPPIFLIECCQMQSLNTCKRLGVSGHIP